MLFFGFWRRFFYKYVLWSFSPIALFLIMGLFLTLFGGGWGIWVLIYTLGPPVASAGSVLLSVAPLLVGVQMLLYALMLDIQESPDSPMTIDYRRMAEAAAAANAEALSRGRLEPVLHHGTRALALSQADAEKSRVSSSAR